MLQAQLAQGSSSFGQGLELTMAPMGWEFLLQPGPLWAGMQELPPLTLMMFSSSARSMQPLPSTS